MNLSYIQKLFCLDGQKAVVTGASSGIGRAIAVSLANFGAEVALLGRSAEGLKETHRLIGEAGGVCEDYIVDISSTGEQERFSKNISIGTDAWTSLSQTRGSTSAPSCRTPDWRTSKR